MYRLLYKCQLCEQFFQPTQLYSTVSFNDYFQQQHECPMFKGKKTGIVTLIGYEKVEGGQNAERTNYHEEQFTTART